MDSRAHVQGPRAHGQAPFANRIKEPFWLLVYNGVHVQSRYASAPDCQRRCRCGSQDDSPSAVQDLPHAFWQCPVAQDIRSLVQHHLRECGVLQSTAEITQANLWLAINPGAMATWVWDVTAAVAIYAIDQGRRELDSARSEDLDPGVRLTRARTRARGAFWQGLVWAAQTIMV